MRDIVYDLLAAIEEKNLHKNDVIAWAVPIVSFGKLLSSEVATLGLNPSNCEFMCAKDVELTGSSRRFPTLSYFGLKKWSKIDAKNLKTIVNSYDGYFESNPYDRWFKSLDYLISSTGHSYYSEKRSACHLDLVPFATQSKWGMLSKTEQDKLIEISSSFLGRIISESKVKVLILNGKSVVTGFEKISDIKFCQKEMRKWDLPRKSGNSIRGFGYEGFVSKVGGIDIKKSIRVIGFNHNIQSSFGVTTEVRDSIRDWIGKRV